MAIFNRLSKEEIREKYTHYAMFCGIAPVYINFNEDNDIAVRNWFPEWIFDVALFAFDIFCFMQQTIDPDFESGWPICVTGKIER